MYGDKELELLTTTYSELIDYSKCMFKWDMFKETMRANYKECKFHKLIIKLVTDESLYMQYPALSTLAEIQFTQQMLQRLNEGSVFKIQSKQSFEID